VLARSREGSELALDLSMLARILVPLDGSPASLAALDHALSLAEREDARVELLHVDAPDTIAAPAPDARREFERSFDEAFSIARDRVGDRASRRVVSGDPVRKIVETARDGHYNLIVMGTHAEGTVKRIIWGSISKSVVERAPCPVLLVPVHGAPRT